MAKLKTVERLTEDLQDIIKKLYTRMDGTDKEKRETIENEIKKIIEEAINSKAVKKSNPRAFVSDEIFIQEAKKDPNSRRLAQKFGYRQAQITCNRMRNLGIVTDYKIARMIRENPDKDDETIAGEANVDVEAVQKIRKRVKITTKDKVDARKKVSDEEFIKAAKRDPNAERLAQKFEYKSINVVRYKIKNFGIIIDYKIARMIRKNPDKDDETIAAEANVDVEAVQKIREETKAKQIKAYTRKKVSDEEFIKAARKDPNVERLAQKFGYKSINSLRAKMRKIGISTDYKIATMIRENPDKDDETIAAEANVDVEAVQKIREEKVNENSNSTKTIKAEEAEVKDKPVEVKQNVSKKIEDPTDVQQKTLKTAETQQGGVIQESVHLKSQQTIGSIQAQQTTDIREGLKRAEEKQRREDREDKFISLARKLTDPRIIAKEMNMHLETVYNKLKYYGIWDRKRVVENLNKSNEEIAASGKIELSAVEQVRRQEASKNTIQAKEIQLQKQIQRKRAEQSNPKQIQLEKMAKRFEPIDKIEGATGIPEYEIILWLRKHKVASRTEVERLMENTKMTDEQIASKSGGNVEDIKKIREIVKKREKLIARIPETIRTSIISALNSNNGFVSEPYIIKKFNITLEQFRALKQKWIRDRGSAVSESKRRVDLKNEINSIRTIASNNGSSVKIKIARMLALYDDLLTPAEYALFAYKYYQTGNYLEAVELGKEHLGLNMPTVAGILRRIKEVTDQAKEQKSYQITIGED